ncbi:MAG: Pyrroline-5-carboxylate reductase [uncultured Thermomicrobiales bacterium]|uniref:Pyrroline-5-carboxylate reductase n=1 Tax=uncultured Thermomicrobiales bacterium TaxID=1645740 RepID=A0A6J4V3N7_9BACT|nr:MAG: Pyrroline-5-carboxylate reductase [uncultured Thermomicrobiales bacterium]
MAGQIERDRDQAHSRGGDGGRVALADARLAFVGAGVMAESMIAGLLGRGMIEPDRIVASHPRPDRRRRLTERFGIAAVEGNREAAAGVDLVLLTVKPQVLSSVMRQLHGRLEPRQVAVSVIAGAGIASLSRGLGHDAIVRVMPNTPAQVGAGMSVWTSTADVDDGQRARVRAVLSALGEELWVEEEKYVDMATALSGTGPTYVFLMMEALIDAGVHMGFPRRIAEQIVLQTVAGSVAFARDSGKHMAELRNMVTSPGGTSAEAIYQMEKGGLRTVFSRAVYAAYQRTQTLGKEEAARDGDRR